MNDSLRFFDYQFIIDLGQMRDICRSYLADVGLKDSEINMAGIRAADRRLAAALRELQYVSAFVGEVQLEVQLRLNEFPTGYYWFGRDLGAALTAALISAACRRRHKKSAELWQRVFDSICENIRYAAAHPEIREP